jgi:hypothetical protein
LIPTSVVPWEGPSLFTGDKVQVVVTGLVRPSANIKTGPMVQANLIVAGKHPLDVLGTPLERAICGDCEHVGKGTKFDPRTCYVHHRMLLHLALASKFPKVSLEKLAELLDFGRGLRLGEYGDFGLIPYEVTGTLTKSVRFWTGYTQQWDNCDQRLRSHLMASVSSPAARAKAKLKGWRTYRIRANEFEKPEKGEIVCPFETKGMQCLECKRCDGANSKGPDLLITIHGRGANAFKEKKAA